MKVAMVTISPPGSLGHRDVSSRDVHVHELSRELARRGYDVDIYACGQPVTELFDSTRAPEAVQIHRRVLDTDTDLDEHLRDCGAWLAKAWAEDPPHLVHAHLWSSGVAAQYAASPLGIPVVQSFHSLATVERRALPPEEGAAEHVDDLDRRAQYEDTLATTADGVLACSTAEARELRAIGANAARMTLVPRGVDLARFTPKNGWRPPEPPYRVLATGPLDTSRGIDTVIATLDRLPDVTLVVAGGPPRAELDDCPEVRRLRGVADDLGVSERVELLGRVPHDEMPVLLRSADVVVSVPARESFGMLPLEAMACGVPVVASSVGGHTDTVVNGETGQLVPPRHPDKLTQALNGLLTDPARHESHSHAAAQRTVSNYSWARIVRETEAFYREVTAAAARPDRHPQPA